MSSDGVCAIRAGDETNNRAHLATELDINKAAWDAKMLPTCTSSHAIYDMEILWLVLLPGYYK